MHFAIRPPRAVLFLALLTGTDAAQEILPFPPTPSVSSAGRTMQESTYAQRVHPSHLPADAPNIVIALIDDAGPALAGTYCGAVHTPTLDRIADEGISYNRFHTTSMGSPTRASLLTGRNHHHVVPGRSRNSPTTGTDTPVSSPRPVR